MHTPIIVKAFITGTSNLKTAIAILSNGEQVELFTFYEDEILVAPFELENKTVEQAKQIKHDKSVVFDNTYQSIDNFSFSGSTM